MLQRRCDTAACCERHPRACTHRVDESPSSTAESPIARPAYDVPRGPPHVTYVAFHGKDKVALEVSRSAFTLMRYSRTARAHVLTDDPTMEQQLQSHGLSDSRVIVQLLAREAVLERFAAFGLTKMAHHSGLGGYCKLLIADLLPLSVDATIVLDSDTMLVNDVALLWGLRRSILQPRRTRGSGGAGAVLAAKRLATGGVCLRGQRINSGVVLMDLRRMRQLNWTSTLLHRIRMLGTGNVPARACGKMVRNGSIAAGDQELLSFGCLRAYRGACVPLPEGMHQDKCDGMGGGGHSLVLHFVNTPRLERICPFAQACRRSEPSQMEHAAAPACLNLALMRVSCWALLLCALCWRHRIVEQGSHKTARAGRAPGSRANGKTWYVLVVGERFRASSER